MELIRVQINVFTFSKNHSWTLGDIFGAFDSIESSKERQTQIRNWAESKLPSYCQSHAFESKGIHAAHIPNRMNQFFRSTIPDQAPPDIEMFIFGEHNPQQRIIESTASDQLLICVWFTFFVTESKPDVKKWNRKRLKLRFIWKLFERGN